MLPCTQCAVFGCTSVYGTTIQQNRIVTPPLCLAVRYTAHTAHTPYSRTAHTPYITIQHPSGRAARSRLCAWRFSWQPSHRQRRTARKGASEHNLNREPWWRRKDAAQWGAMPRHAPPCPPPCLAAPTAAPAPQGERQTEASWSFPKENLEATSPHKARRESTSR